MKQGIPIHPALVQPVLIAGAERELTILVGFLALMVFVAGKSFVAAGLSTLLWVAGSALGRLLARRDGQAVKVYLRHIRYRAFYPAAEGIF